MADLQPLLDFLAAQRDRQAAHFPALPYPKVLSFMGTTSRPGTFAAVGVCPLRRLEPGPTPQELRVHLAGALPRAPERLECVTVHLTHVRQFQGYQIKTRPVGADGATAGLFTAGADGLTVEGSQIFTVHHSPYTMKFFEQIPFDEVQQTVGALPFALVAVGETANLSPRFVFHHEVKDGQLALFHGDGLALKTYMNLKANRQETRLVLDLDDYTGFAVRGTVEEFQPHQHPEAHARIAQGFAAGDWGKPSRTFRFVAQDWRPIGPG